MDQDEERRIIAQVCAGDANAFEALVVAYQKQVYNLALRTVGIQRRGLGGYLKSFIKPFLLMLPLNLIEQIVRPFSLALRLYGNLYGEEMVTHELGNLFPLVLPLLMQVLSLLFCLIQAIVFTMLLSIYIEEAIEE